MYVVPFPFLCRYVQTDEIFQILQEETATLISSALAALGGKPEEAHKEEGHKEEEHYAPTDGESKEQKRGTFQQEGETGPTNMGPARAAAVVSRESPVAPRVGSTHWRFLPERENT